MSRRGLSFALLRWGPAQDGHRLAPGVPPSPGLPDLVRREVALASPLGKRQSALGSVASRDGGRGSRPCTWLRAPQDMGFPSASAKNAALYGLSRDANPEHTVDDVFSSVSPSQAFGFPDKTPNVHDAH